MPCLFLLFVKDLFRHASSLGCRNVLSLNIARFMTSRIDGGSDMIERKYRGSEQLAEYIYIFCLKS